MNIKALTPFLLSFIITGVVFSAFIFLTGITKSELEKLLEEDEYHILGGVRVYNSVNDELTNLISDEITMLNKELSNIFGPFSIDDELNILLFTNLNEIQKHSNLEDVGAFYNNEYNLISLLTPSTMGEVDVWFFRRDLRHEYTHFYFQKYLAENKITNIPIWFEEGLAEYIAVTMDGLKRSDDLREVINFELLNSKKDWANYRREHSQLYLQSHYAIIYIIENNDIDILKKIVDDSYKYNFKESMKNNTNIEINQLHKLIN
jgi:hypothetical protein